MLSTRLFSSKFGSYRWCLEMSTSQIELLLQQNIWTRPKFFGLGLIELSRLVIFYYLFILKKGSYTAAIAAQLPAAWYCRQLLVAACNSYTTFYLFIFKICYINLLTVRKWPMRCFKRFGLGRFKVFWDRVTDSPSRAAKLTFLIILTLIF